MRKPQRLYLLLLMPLLCSCANSERMESQRWRLVYNNGIDIYYDGRPVMRGMTAEYSLGGGEIISSKSYSSHSFASAKTNDGFGKGMRWTITYSASGKPELLQTFRVYDDCILTDISLASDDSIKTNYMAPIVAQTTNTMLCDGSRRTLFVPFDNDNWVRYSSVKDTGDKFRSYEVTCVYDADSREGVVVGAIEHDNWKNAIDLTSHSRALKAFCGVADSLTRDTAAHGFLRGKQVKSATMMIGVFDDWRTGLERYADANALIAPPRKWDKAMPVGWNSWGALQFNVNCTNSIETSDFISSELQAKTFRNSDGLVYTGLDSGWNSFTEEELKRFADRCQKNNQVPCIYWTPFTDWGKEPERPVQHAGQYKYKDAYLYANGRPQELDGAYALDPTHPAVQAAMEAMARLFRRCGFKYVKVDFMTHGRMEADRWHRKDITTGTQAYNYGMHLLDSIFSDMYLNLSISPIFPAQYAQSRRIACDAWNKIKDTEYTMNALSFGWWLDRVYNFNDADHVVLRDATEGENRARITSSVITGLFIAGDDFSAGGDVLAKERAKKLLTNQDVNSIATGRSFRPLDGNDERSEHAFIREEANGDICLAVFNYESDPKKLSLPLRRMGIKDADGYDVSELWSHKDVDANSEITLAGKDAMIFLFKKK